MNRPNRFEVVAGVIWMCPITDCLELNANHSTSSSPSSSSTASSAIAAATPTTGSSSATKKQVILSRAQMYYSIDQWQSTHMKSPGFQRSPRLHSATHSVILTHMDQLQAMIDCLGGDEIERRMLHFWPHTYKPLSPLLSSSTAALVTHIESFVCVLWHEAFAHHGRLAYVGAASLLDRKRLQAVVDLINGRIIAPFLTSSVHSGAALA
jgi:hypothetical protein